MVELKLHLQKCYWKKNKVNFKSAPEHFVPARFQLMKIFICFVLPEMPTQSGCEYFQKLRIQLQIL